MKPKNQLLVILYLLTCNLSFGLTISNTLIGNDIPTNNQSYDGNCNGATSPLTIVLPAGGPWVVNFVDVQYEMTSSGGGWKSEQRSRLFCQNTGLNEGGYISGTGNSGGVQLYNRTGLNIANGQFAGGTNLSFELQAYRTWTGMPGCNDNVAKINGGTWQITVDYELAIPMTYVSSVTSQLSITNVKNCVDSTQILKIEVETSGTLGAIELTQIDLTTNGSTSLGEISNINVYYTGTSNSFLNVNLFGTVASNGNVIVNGNQGLQEGVNYFWVEYLLNVPTTVSNLLDGTCTGITIDGVLEIPSITSPAGHRMIGVCNPDPGGINNEQVWLLSVSKFDAVDSNGGLEFSLQYAIFDDALFKRRTSF